MSSTAQAGRSSPEGMEFMTGGKVDGFRLGIYVFEDACLPTASRSTPRSGTTWCWLGCCSPGLARRGGRPAGPAAGPDRLGSSSSAAAELAEPCAREALARLRALAADRPVTLLTATKDLNLSQAVVLAGLLPETT